jgi:hypothetical protein
MPISIIRRAALEHDVRCAHWRAIISNDEAEIRDLLPEQRRRLYEIINLPEDHPLRATYPTDEAVAEVAHAR